MGEGVRLTVDLHTHSCRSDGELTPAELVDAARAAGLEVLALTDHDTTSGVREAAERASAVGLALVPGIELSVNGDGGRLQLHLLGYGIDLDDAALAECLEQLESARVARARRAVELLAGLGVGLDWDRLRASAGEGTIGRPHIAAALVEAGHCTSPDQAFARYLRRGRPAFVPAPGLSPGRALALVHGAGGIASLAHPFLSAGVDAAGGIEKFVGRLVVQGLDAIEVHHPRHKRAQRQRLSQLAGRYGLLVTGGSDFHGASKPDIALGSIALERERYDRLRERFTRV